MAHWLDNELWFEGFASEAEHFVLGLEHDGRISYPDHKKVAEDLIESGGREAWYRWLFMDFTPKDVSYLSDPRGYLNKLIRRSPLQT